MVGYIDSKYTSFEISQICNQKSIQDSARSASNVNWSGYCWHHRQRTDSIIKLNCQTVWNVNLQQVNITISTRKKIRWFNIKLE